MTRWTRAVDLLVPDGVLALFGRPGELMDPALRAAVDEIEEPVLGTDGPAVPGSWSIEDITDVDGLTDGVEQDLVSATTTTTAAFVARLATTSAYLMLHPEARAEARAEALRQVGAALPDRVEIDGTVQMSLARRI